MSVDLVSLPRKPGARPSPTEKTKKIPKLRGHRLFGKTLPFFSRERSVGAAEDSFTKPVPRDLGPAIPFG